MGLDPASFALLLLAWPFVINLLSVVKSRSRAAFFAVAIATTAGLAVAVFCHGPVAEPIRICRWVVFALDTPSWMFVGLVYVCWPVTLIYCIGYTSVQFPDRAEKFHRFMSATVGLSVGAGMAGNFFTLIVFYLAAIPSILPLLTIRDDAASRSAARFYLHSTLWPALAIAIPVIVISFPLDLPFEEVHVDRLGWSRERSAIVLAMIIIGFSKNCIAPFHLWLPRSAIAAAPVTAMVHSVAAVQVATIALFKIAKNVYGAGLLESLCEHFFQTGWILYLCGGTAVYTAYRAWKTPNLKERFSFSTVGQLSYIITAILVGTQSSMQGAMLHIVTHSIAKLNLFLCAGAYLTTFGTFHAPGVADAIPGRRWVGVAAVLSGLSIGGFPFLAGYYSKDLMLHEEWSHHHYSAALFLLVGSLLNFVYIFPLIRATCRRATPDTPAPGPLPVPMAVAIVICTGLLLTLSAFGFSVMKYLKL